MQQKTDMHDKDKAIISKALSVRFVHYNVQTLKDASDEIGVHTRIKFAMCAIACLQENKKYSGIEDMRGYYRCIAAGEHGDHGVEVAISSFCPLAINDEEGENICIIISPPQMYYC